ncbi:MAG: hypothetical protein R3F34_18745 [Planctomycetota bacterium]
MPLVVETLRSAVRLHADRGAHDLAGDCRRLADFYTRREAETAEAHEAAADADVDARREIESIRARIAELSAQLGSLEAQRGAQLRK